MFSYGEGGEPAFSFETWIALHQSLESITAPLVSLIVEQSHTYDQEAKVEQLRAKKEAIKQHKQLDSAAAAELENKLPNNLNVRSGISGWVNDS